MTASDEEHERSAREGVPSAARPERSAPRIKLRVVASMAYVGAVFALLRLGPWSDAVRRLLDASGPPDYEAAFTDLKQLAQRWEVIARTAVMLLVWCDLAFTYAIKDKRIPKVTVPLALLYFGVYASVPMAETVTGLARFTPHALLMLVGAVLILAPTFWDQSDRILASVFTVGCALLTGTTPLHGLAATTTLMICLVGGLVCYAILFFCMWRES
jgi:hypothetical protein